MQSTKKIHIQQQVNISRLNENIIKRRIKLKRKIYNSEAHSDDPDVVPLVFEVVQGVKLDHVTDSEIFPIAGALIKCKNKNIVIRLETKLYHMVLNGGSYQTVLKIGIGRSFKMALNP